MFAYSLYMYMFFSATCTVAFSFICYILLVFSRRNRKYTDKLIFPLWGMIFICSVQYIFHTCSFESVGVLLISVVFSFLSSCIFLRQKRVKNSNKCMKIKVKSKKNKQTLKNFGVEHSNIVTKMKVKRLKHN